MSRDIKKCLPAVLEGHPGTFSWNVPDVPLPNSRNLLVPLHRGFDGLRAAWMPGPTAGEFWSLRMGGLGWGSGRTSPAPLMADLRQTFAFANAKVAQ
jgi:hypothetical protein